MITQRDRERISNRRDHARHSALIGHRACHLRSACVGDLALQNFRNGNIRIAGIHVKGTGTRDDSARFVVCGKTLEQFVRRHGVAGQVDQGLASVDYFVDVLIGHKDGPSFLPLTAA